MISAKEIQQTFSKCSLILADNKISAVYPRSNRFITQTLSGDNRLVFEILLDKAAVYEIAMNPLKGTRLVFEFNERVCTSPITFMPLEQELTEEELNKRAVDIVRVRAEDNPLVPPVNLAEFYKDVDLYNEDEVLDYTRRLFETYRKLDFTSVNNISGLRRWHNLKSAFVRFFRSTNIGEVEFFDPDGHMDGASAEVSYEFDKPKNIRFSKRNKNLLSEVVRSSDSIVLEFGFPENEAILNFSFNIENIRI